MTDTAYNFDAYLQALGYRVDYGTPGGDYYLRPIGKARGPRHGLPGNEGGSYSIDDLADHRRTFPHALPWWVLRRRIHRTYPDAHYACLDRHNGAHRAPD
ncbi:hypothetical protein L5G28_07555 [Gordonia sp. HY285]|uniref:hypothetical protein n=1 Tax=Gordonia liuliyuniae TaxID=2911517 RepID=UPI001F47A1CB|nr:hypothetical protein [Gordonia liuliyuniae]MCF8610016.1 hypothetical protein [Gordonia liuliyuniae]